ncbi:MAG: hypothetical protein CL661_06545 [Bacteroidetes bacterium]|jgi:hypothetical protein|nr:hypothetical protein [Bacteroidota bacterium]|tara:strand:+ start:964 stop:1896 length:933 start_codon:yes stop_codon:yes gene_type:complete
MRLSLVILFLILSILVRTQNEITHNIVEITVDNDLVFLNDRYYSNGVTLKIYSPTIKKSPINRILLPSDIDEIIYYALSITHHLYTPDEVSTSEIQLTDHPYATYLLLGNSKMSFNYKKRIKKTSGMAVGLIGSAAGGEYIQNRLHSTMAAAYPSEGWQNQVKNDLCLQYSAVIEKGFVDFNWFELNGMVGATLGVPHTEANIGSSFRIGYFNDYFHGLAVDASSRWQAWIYCSGSIFLINYNASLQGGTLIQDNVHTISNINSSLLHASLGGVLQYKRLSIEYGMVVRSPEFPTAYWHRWGHLNVSFAF